MGIRRWCEARTFLDLHGAPASALSCVITDAAACSAARSSPTNMAALAKLADTLRLRQYARSELPLGVNHTDYGNREVAWRRGCGEAKGTVQGAD